METEIKPKVLKTVKYFTKEYNKLAKYQKKNLVYFKFKSIFSSKRKNMKNK